METLHQYIERNSGQVKTEKLKADRFISVLYSAVRENAGFMFKTLTSRMVTDLVAWSEYDNPITRNGKHIRRMVGELGIDTSEILDFESIRTGRDLFERRIAYWNTRPMPEKSDRVVSPCDARMIPGVLGGCDRFFIKEKFFDFEELLGPEKENWREAFTGGSYAVFRLTPDKYHYNHTPVTGRVVDFYELNGRYHSCNPGAVIELATPYSKNRRVVTVFDSDIPGGTGAGLVAMIEIVALMIGDIRQAYSHYAYENPVKPVIGDALLKGRPKSLFRPGSSTVVLLFQKDRFMFSKDLLDNANRCDVVSRFSKGFGEPLVETEIAVRTEIGRALNRRITLTF